MIVVDDAGVMGFEDDDLVNQIENYYEKKEKDATVEITVNSTKPGIFQRLTTGNMLLSQKTKCLNFLKKRITREAEAVSKTSLKIKGKLSNF